jgi:HPr kinase/phosphorylase
LGVINIRSIFGETAVRPRKTLKLIVHLEKPDPGELAKMERLPLNSSSQTIMGIDYPKVILPVAEGRNLAVLVEAATRNFILRSRGIDSARQFIERHERMMMLEAGDALSEDSDE